MHQSINLLDEDEDNDDDDIFKIDEQEMEILGKKKNTSKLCEKIDTWNL